MIKEVLHKSKVPDELKQKFDQYQRDPNIRLLYMRLGNISNGSEMETIETPDGIKPRTEDTVNEAISGIENQINDILTTEYSDILSTPQP